MEYLTLSELEDLRKGSKKASETHFHSFNTDLKQLIRKYFNEEELVDNPNLVSLLREVSEEYDRHDHLSNLKASLLKEEFVPQPDEDYDDCKQKVVDLQSSAADLSALIDNTDDLICSVNEKYELVTFNSQFALFLRNNFLINPAIGSTFFDGLPGEKGVFWYTQFKKALAGERFVVEIEEGEGILIDCYEAFFSPIYKNLEIVGVSVFMRNVTAKRRIENNLKASEERYRLSFENNMMAMASIGESTHFKYVNKAFCDLTGYSEDELMGMQLSDLNEGEDTLGRSKELINKLISREIDHFKIEKEYCKKDGSIIKAKVFVVGAFDATGKFRETWATVQDITATKAYEQKLTKLVDDLTIANIELKRFAHVMSHEMKSPIRAIGQLSQWIYDDNYEALGDTAKEQLDLLKGRVSRLYNHVDGILEYNKIGGFEDQKELVDTEEIIHQEVVDIMDIPESLRIEFDTPFPEILASKLRIAQLFEILISNAVKFMNRTDGTINLGCIEEQQDWKFYVKDDGMGIDPQYHDRIFVLFQTLMPRDKMENTGIGLSMAKKIVQQHGGKIWVDSRPGEGATFWFTLEKA